MFGQLQKTNMERAMQYDNRQQVEEIKKELLAKNQGYVPAIQSQGEMTGSLAREDPTVNRNVKSRERSNAVTG